MSRRRSGRGPARGSGRCRTVGHGIAGQLGFGGAHERHFGNGVDADRLQVPHIVGGLVECVISRQPALIHRGGRQGGKTNHITDAEDVFDLVRKCSSTSMRPRSSTARPALSRSSPRCGPAAGRVHDGLGCDLFSAGQPGQGAGRTHLDTAHHLAETERHGEVAQMKPKRLDDFGVTEVQHRVALFHHRYLGAKRGEDRGVLDADHAGPDHDHRRRNGFRAE